MAEVGTKAVVGGVGAGLVLATAGLLAFINGWENGSPQFKDTVVYADKLAGGLPTACGGLTKHITDTPIIVGEKWPAAKCEAEMGKAVAKVQAQLLRCFKVTPPQPVFDMATAHAWNFGAPSTCGSGAMRAWNAEQWALGCRRLALDDADRPIWSYVKTGRTLPNGKPEMRFVQGLKNRREAEMKGCMEGVVP